MAETLLPAVRPDPRLKTLAAPIASMESIGNLYSSKPFLRWRHCPDGWAMKAGEQPWIECDPERDGENYRWRYALGALRDGMMRLRPSRRS